MKTSNDSMERLLQKLKKLQQQNPDRPYTIAEYAQMLLNEENGSRETRSIEENGPSDGPSGAEYSVTNNDAGSLNKHDTEQFR
jgi:hypothetical protein